MDVEVVGQEKDLAAAFFLPSIYRFSFFYSAFYHTGPGLNTFSKYWEFE